MAQPRPAVIRFVHAAAGAEMARAGDPPADGGAAGVLARLSERLGKLAGPAGFDVLLARAVVLARRDHPVLTGVTAGAGGRLLGLPVLEPGAPQAGLRDGALAVVGQLLEILIALIGDDFAMRLVGEIWPEAAKASEGDET